LYLLQPLNPDAVQLEWNNPDVDGLIQFLVTEKGFKYVILHISGLPLTSIQ
jgi:hypothetical protein